MGRDIDGTPPSMGRDIDGTLITRRPPTPLTRKSRPSRAGRDFTEAVVRPVSRSAYRWP
ncbi:hypothetical protein GCM10027072_53120 [Streptomyces bullii]